jgi:hypothetical protein
MSRILPEPPRNVYGIIHGHRYAMRLSYWGVNDYGYHVWVAAWPHDDIDLHGFEGGLVEFMPEKTSVVFAGADPFPDWRPPW